MIPAWNIYLLLIFPLPAIAIGLFLAGLVVQLYRDIRGRFLEHHMHHVTSIASGKKPEPP